MGLGKTVQLSSFISGLFRGYLVTYVLVVFPVPLLEQWLSELEKWAPNTRVRRFHGPHKDEREKQLSSVVRSGGVCLTSYGLIINEIDKLNSITWDYIIMGIV